MKRVDPKHSSCNAVPSNQKSIADEIGWEPLDYAFDGSGFQIARFSKTGATGATDQDIYVLNEEVPEFVRVVNQMWLDFAEEITADIEANNIVDNSTVEIGFKGQGTITVDMGAQSNKIAVEIAKLFFDIERLKKAHKEDAAAEVAEHEEQFNEQFDEFDGEAPLAIR